jgi:hypothetical protein
VNRDLEYPDDWDSLYLARGDEVQAHRPVFTGDVYSGIEVPGESKNRAVMILQHPCALRSDGVTLHNRLLVAKVRPHPLIQREDWRGHIAKMPLPELIPSTDSGRRHQAAFFDELYLVAAAGLDPAKRIACMSQTGVNYLLQRWVHHNSRMLVPTWQYQQVSSAQYEEADLTEYWCEERMEDGLSIEEASVEALKWLREDAGDGVMRQQLLEDPQRRSAVRREMREHLKDVRQEHRNR